MQVRAITIAAPLTESLADALQEIALLGTLAEELAAIILEETVQEY
jgi:hypothetical protein